MNYIDLAIIALVLLEIGRGFDIGLFRQSFSMAGFWGGLVAGGMLAPLALANVSDSGWKLWLALALVFGSGLILGSAGEMVGLKLAQLAHRLRLGVADRVLGGVLGAVMVLVFVWLGSAMLANTPSGFSQAISQSRIVRWLDGRMPPAPPYLSRIQRLLTPNGFPQVFIGLEPEPAEPANPASSADVAKAIQTTGPSVVKIESAACGGVIDGSGFVAGANTVATNAHVVAGVRAPFVVDRGGRHPATVVYFNPDLDLAVLKTSGLVGQPLPILPTDVRRGTAAVAMGYPGGGPLTGVPAAILAHRLATGRNIYGQGIVTRSIYEMQSDIRQGNSGGPVVTPEGTVIGVVFAKSQNNQGIGYALTSSEVLPEIRQAEASSQPVGTGACVPD